MLAHLPLRTPAEIEPRSTAHSQQADPRDNASASRRLGSRLHRALGRSMPPKHPTTASAQQSAASPRPSRIVAELKLPTHLCFHASPQRQLHALFKLDLETSGCIGGLKMTLTHLLRSLRARLPTDVPRFRPSQELFVGDRRRILCYLARRVADGQRRWTFIRL